MLFGRLRHVDRGLLLRKLWRVYFTSRGHAPSRLTATAFTPPLITGGNVSASQAPDIKSVRLAMSSPSSFISVIVKRFVSASLF